MSDPPLTRVELQRLSSLRRSEAKSLLDARQFAGAYYLLGYAVECALKACIAKHVPRNTFPQRNSKDLYVHDLVALRRFAGLEAEMVLDNAVQLNWMTVKDWSERSRYYLVDDEIVVKAFYSACTVRTNGVLPWLTRKW